MSNIDISRIRFSNSTFNAIPLIPDDANTVAHVLFDENGLIDTKANPWEWSSPTTYPPIFKALTGTNNLGTSRVEVGTFSDANYFTQGSAGSGLTNINGAFIAAFAFTADDVSNGPIIFSNYSGTAGHAGYLVQLTPGAGAYLIGQGFTGPQTLNTTTSGINILIVGCAGTGTTTGFIKLNNGPVQTGSIVYNPSTTAVTTIGRYNLAGGFAFNSKFDELWFSSSTPTVELINQLYLTAVSSQTSGYRWPDTSQTVLHLLGRDFTGTSWVAPQATLTTVGTVGKTTITSYTQNSIIPGRYGIEPAGQACIYANASLTNAGFYQLPAASNVLNFSGDFSGCIIVKPTGADISSTGIYASSGVSEGYPGWQLVNETGATLFIGSTGTVTSSAATADKVNVICFGKSGSNLVLKVNDGRMVTTAGTVTVDNAREGRIGMHWAYDIGLNGAIYELWFSTTTPSDEIFSNIVNNVVSSSAFSGDTAVDTAFRSLTTGLVGVTTGANVPRNATAADIGITAGSGGQTALSSMFIGGGGLAPATGSANTGFGNTSLPVLTSGQLNTAIGYFTEKVLTTGSYNTAVGAAALASTATSDNNTAIGANALVSSTTAGNTAVGSNALGAQTNGLSNTAVGASAGSTSTSHTLCTFLGAAADSATSTGRVYATAIGANATVPTDNTVALGNSAVIRVLIGQKASIYSGAGSPNGSQIGSPGDIYLNTSGGAGTTLYVKESGSATNTGWVGK